jgi:signal transduction histidine kinase
MSLKSPPSLAKKLTLSFTSTFIFLLAVLFISLYSSINALLEHQMDEDLEEDVEELNLLYQQSGFNRLLDELKSETAFGEHENAFIRLFDNDNSLIYQSELSEWQGLGVSSAGIEKGREIHTEIRDIPGREYLTHIVTASIGDNYLLQIGESSEEKQEIMDLLLQSFLWTFVLSLPIVAYITYIIARRSARNIGKVNEATLAIAAGDFSKRVLPQNSEYETQALAESFNQMADKIQALIKEMREMTDNIAHDLRSPLGRIRAIAEMSLTGKQVLEEYQQASENTLHECDRLLGLINMTLDVAEAEAGILRTENAQVDISNLVVDVCDLFEPTAEQKQIEINSTIETNVHMKGNLGSLQRMVGNLLDNAIKYTPQGGLVKVALERTSSGVRITVIDSGIGIASNDRMRVFERFFRSDESRTMEGSGLGLSYSRAVARAYGGDIEVTSEPHKGSQFTVLLPV